MSEDRDETTAFLPGLSAIRHIHCRHETPHEGQMLNLMCAALLSDHDRHRISSPPPGERSKVRGPADAKNRATAKFPGKGVTTPSGAAHRRGAPITAKVK